MPPKGPSKKTEIKKQEKIIEDKTFGLKNKNKSKAVQNYVKSVANQVKGVNQKGGESKLLAEEFEKKALKKKEEERKALLSSLFKTVKKVQEEESEEEEEEVEDRYEEIDLYTDQRDQIYGSKEGDIDEDELANWRANKTDKICKFFLDSVEAGKYGWRWICPNGLGCIYKHALPLGYSLKRDQGQEEKKDDTTLEEGLEKERAQLQGGTPVTLERFLKWKEDKKLQKEKDIEKKRQDEARKTGGKGVNVLSGRALFTYDPSLFQDDAEALDNEEYEEEENREEEEQKQDGGIREEDDEEEEEEGGEENGEEEPEAKNWGGDEEEKKEDVKASAGEANGEKVGEANKEGAAEGEVKKKKKKKNKKKAAENGENGDVKINEDVFLNEDDVELPEDDS